MSSSPARRPLDFDYALGAVVVGAAVVILATPFSVVEYPPIVDLPGHAAQTSAFRHYLDPAFHFRDQFELHPFAVPYLSMYVLGALFMTVLPMLTAVKLAAVVMLALLPLGLAVLCHGMKKSPLLGAAGLMVVWGPLTSWGFLNFVGALGLFAMVVGLSLLVEDRPTRGRWLALVAALLGVFFTHVFRYPFAVAAMVGAPLVIGGVTRRLRPFALLALPSFALLGLWMAVRPPAIAVTPSALGLHPDRLGELVSSMWSDSVEPMERGPILFGWLTLAAVGVVSGLAGRRERVAAPEAWPPPAFRARATLIALGCATASLVLYLTLPMTMGIWWLIYPREATATLFLALGALPDLPRARGMRAGLVLALCAAAFPAMLVNAASYARFDAATEDYRKIVSALPDAPKLLYLVFEEHGSQRTISPFTHLPAYVQAERGGWLSFHFARLGASPLVYRPREGREQVIPPPTPLYWEVNPGWFEVKEHGSFFDWFLVRSTAQPDVLFRADPSIRLVSHEGTWWLYRRSTGEAGAAPSEPPT